MSHQTTPRGQTRRGWVCITVITLSALLVGCAGEHGDPYTVEELSNKWVAMGGDPADTTSGSLLGADELALVEPQQCAIIENAWSGSPYSLDDIESTDPGTSGRLTSFSTALSAPDPDFPAPSWSGSSRVFVSTAAADSYMEDLASAIPDCASYTVGGGDPVQVLPASWDTGSLRGVSFNFTTVLQDENLVFVLNSSGLETAIVQPDLTAFVSALLR